MSKIISVSSPAGIYTPVDLVKISQASRSDGFMLGRRQNILIDSAILPLGLSSKVTAQNLPLKYPNITCSHAAGGINLKQNDWAYITDAYQEALDGFDFEPELEVNICSTTQSLFPLFSSKLNFISSEIDGLWHLVIMLRQHRVLLPELLRTSQIAKSVKLIQTALQAEPYLSSDAIAARLENELALQENSTSKLMLAPLDHEDFEGFHQMKNGRIALNIFSNHKTWKNDFIREFAALAQSQDLNRIYVTAGRSLLLKHIHRNDLHSWEQLLGKHNISLRHSEQDLTWIVPSHQKHLVHLKEKLIHRLNQQGFSSHGLHIAINPRDADCGAPILLYAQKRPLGNTYSVKYKKDFDYRLSGFIDAKRNMNFAQLIDCLQNLQQQFHRQSLDNNSIEIIPAISHVALPAIHECPDCLSQYQEAHGDPTRKIEPGTPFDLLPDTWNCPICETEKALFRSINN